MNFSTLRSELADRLQLDATVTANKTRLERWLNAAQDHISGRYEWPFLEERDSFQTVADKTAGTVAITKGLAAVTGAGTSFAATDVGSFLNVDGSNDWYEILTYVSATSITIKPNFGATTVTAATYILRKIFYSVDSDVNRILSVKQYNTPIKLTQVAMPTLDRLQPRITLTGSPRTYALFRLDPTGYPQYAKQKQMVFFPSPNDTYTIEVRYTKFLTDMVDGNDISQIPQQWHEVLLSYAEHLGGKYLNLPNVPQLKQDFEVGLQTMIQEETALGDYFPVVNASDTQQQSSRFLPFPGTFEQPY